MECLGIRCFVEIQIATEHFVGSFATQNHFDTHAFDDAGKEIHRGRSTYGRYIVGLDIIDNVAEGVQTFLDRVVDLVVDGSDRIGYLAGGDQVGGTFQADGERMKLRPPGIGFTSGLDTLGGIFLGDGGSNRRIQATGKEHAIRYVAHQLALHGSFESVMEFFYAGGVVFHVFVIHPVADVPFRKVRIFAVKVVAGLELVVDGGEAFQTFQFGGDEKMSVVVVTHI